jgi:molybdopterin-biosynthesis enzyme MoeA-like protein
MATGKSKRNKKLTNVFNQLTQPQEDSSMTLNGLTETQIAQLIQSMEVNPTIEAHIKEPTLQWVRLQLEEQQKGGAWKARIREAGHVI